MVFAAAPGDVVYLSKILDNIEGACRLMVELDIRTQ